MVLSLLGAAALAWYFVPGVYLEYSFVGAAGAIAATCVLALALRGETDTVVLWWVALFPLGYYFFSFPRERPLVAFDRVVVLLLCVAACFAPPSAIKRVPGPMRRAAWAWALFVFAVLLSFVHLTSLLSPSRVLVDAYVLPALLGWCVIRCFPVRQHLRTLHVLLCVMAAYLAAIGAAEIVLGKDLLPLPGAGAYFAGLGESLVFRPNGPFLASHSLGLIGLFGFCFLTFLRRAAQNEFPRWQKWLHWGGVSAAAIAAFLPLFRSIMLTFVLLVILDAFFARRARRFVRVAGLSALVGGLLLTAWLLLPEIFVERFLNPANLFGRIAQQRQTLQVFEQNPITGVGFTNYTAGVQRLRSSEASFEDVEAVDSPHNSLGAVLSETGLAGFTTLALSHGLFFLAFWRVRRTKAPGALLVWPFFLYLFLSYWLNGLSISTIYSSDLNFFYVFVTTALYKYVITEHAKA
jgi:O-antigen ligase